MPRGLPHFHVILTGQSISEIILIIQCHLQGQKVNFKTNSYAIRIYMITKSNDTKVLLQLSLRLVA